MHPKGRKLIIGFITKPISKFFSGIRGIFKTVLSPLGAFGKIGEFLVNLIFNIWFFSAVIILGILFFLHKTKMGKSILAKLRPYPNMNFLNRWDNNNAEKAAIVLTNAREIKDRILKSH